MLLAGKFGHDMAAVAEAVICLVLMNAVEVQDSKGRNVGIAVYNTAFSWINHSCSPNAFYRFAETTTEMDCNIQFRIYAAAMIGDDGRDGAPAPASDSTIIGRVGYGPKIIVRSIKEIKKDEEVAISYIDLLQPKVLRHRELIAKYQFSCCSKRCQATPATYVDHALQAIFVNSPDGQNLISDDDLYESNESQDLMDVFDNAFDEYLTFHIPETCCTKLEGLLRQGLPNVRPEPKLETSQSCVRLHQFHHLSLNAYTTVASAYRVRASDLMVFPPDRKHLVETFNMSKISAAYSLLLAAVTHHLFLQESSLIATVANYSICVGESLAFLSRSPMEHTFQKQQDTISVNLMRTSHNCYQVVQVYLFTDKNLTSEVFAEKSGQFLNCIVNLTEKVWNFLTEEGSHLKEIRNHINFRGLLVAKDSFHKSRTHLLCNCYRTVPSSEANEHISQDSVDLYHLGVHCSIYGVYLSIFCFGKQPHLPSDVVKFLYNENILNGIELNL